METTNEDKNCDLLFEYLRSILYDQKVQPLDISKLDAPYQKLGMGLQYLDKAVREMKDYSAALSKGNLSGFTPSRDNLLCENLKNIHANLNHLTWQAKQVAKGDYSQTVSYLGEFSEAFNTMTAQLQERELFLRQEAEREKLEAHQDMLTKVGNRAYFHEETERLLDTNEPLVFCYCDLDHLKYVNDNFGHLEGDWYLRFFARTVQNHIRKEDVFARIGGDEFCIILQHCPIEVAQQKLDAILSDFISDTTTYYSKSFSYGIVEVPSGHGKLHIEAILQQADDAMYAQKRERKNNRTD